MVVGQKIGLAERLIWGSWWWKSNFGGRIKVFNSMPYPSERYYRLAKFFIVQLGVDII